MIEATKNARQGLWKPKILLLAGGLFWLCAAAAGMFLLARYSNSPGQEINPPPHWPASSGMPRDGIRPTLVMFMHPQCPCSRASAGELALLMAHCQWQVNARVLFLQPAEMPSNWCQTELWRETARIPGVRVESDFAGREARLFNAKTSGDTVLYDTKGNLLFHGGITISRGHSGDNDGRAAIENLLHGKPAQLADSPTFGCSLFDCKMKNSP